VRLIHEPNPTDIPDSSNRRLARRFNRLLIDAGLVRGL
jgi:hypothetical protein